MRLHSTLPCVFFSHEIEINKNLSTTLPTGEESFWQWNVPPAPAIPAQFQRFNCRNAIYWTHQFSNRCKNHKIFVVIWSYILLHFSSRSTYFDGFGKVITNQIVLDKIFVKAIFLLVCRSDTQFHPKCFLGNKTSALGFAYKSSKMTHSRAIRYFSNLYDIIQ